MGSTTFRGPGFTGWRIATRLAVVSFSKGTGRDFKLLRCTVAPYRGALADERGLHLLNPLSMLTVTDHPNPQLQALTTRSTKRPGDAPNP
jgi:hypothetical protein